MLAKAGMKTMHMVTDSMTLSPEEKLTSTTCIIAVKRECLSKLACSILTVCAYFTNSFRQDSAVVQTPIVAVESAIQTSLL